MKNFLIHLFMFLSVITISSKKEHVNESTPDANPFKITTLIPLADPIPYQSLGSGKILFERKYDQVGSLFYIIDVATPDFRLNHLFYHPME